MFQLTVELNDDLGEFVEERRQAHGFDTIDQFIEFMLRMESLRLNRERVDQLLLEGLDSGPSRELTRENWDNFRAELDSRQAAKTVASR